MWGFFIVSTSMILAATCYMIATLPAKHVPTQVKVVTASAWLTTLLICCIVPIDVFSTLASQDPKAVGVLWDVCYWSTQILTWILLPLYIGYADAGEFTWRERMIASARSNAMFMFVTAAVGCVGIFWAVSSGNLNLATLPSLAIQLSNTFGLFCVLTLLGYGLVAIPKHLWKHSDPAMELRRQLYRLGRIMDEKVEAQDVLKEAVRKVESTKRALGNSEEVAHQRIDAMMRFIQDDLGDCMDVEPQVGMVQQGVQYTDELPKLHKEIKRDVHWIASIHAQADRGVQACVRLTEIDKARRGELSLPFDATLWQKLSWGFAVHVQPVFMKVLAVAAAALSAVIIWGELFATTSSSLSPLYLLIVSTDNESISQLLIMLPLVYVIVCTFAAIFAINVGAMYSLLPATSSSFSLLFNGNLVARFTAPLCFNYLHVLSMDLPTADGHYTVFAQRMGMQPGDDVAIPFLGTDFNRWAPVIVLLVGCLTLVNAFGKVYRWMSSLLYFLPQAFDEDDDNENSETNLLVAEGQRVVNRNLQQRANGGEGGALLNLAHYVPSSQLLSTERRREQRNHSSDACRTTSSRIPLQGGGTGSPVGSSSRFKASPGSPTISPVPFSGFGFRDSTSSKLT